MKTGIEIIAAERERQINEEGWTAMHDRQHCGEELATAAACYALPRYSRKWFNIWPWHPQWWKPTPNDRVRELSKAGALIAAEIDRLLNDKK
jgi:hypothetical protein